MKEKITKAPFANDNIKANVPGIKRTGRECNFRIKKAHKIIITSRDEARVKKQGSKRINSLSSFKAKGSQGTNEKQQRVNE